jgi:hypothetical protein
MCSSQLQNLTESIIGNYGARARAISAGECCTACWSQLKTSRKSNWPSASPDNRCPPTAGRSAYLTASNMFVARSQKTDRSGSTLKFQSYIATSDGLRTVILHLRKRAGCQRNQTSTFIIYGSSRKRGSRRPVAGSRADWISSAVKSKAMLFAALPMTIRDQY